MMDMISHGGSPSALRDPKGEVAVVVGASTAGMLVARVLLRHFYRVLLLERDALDHGLAARKGLRQAQHVHALLPAGLEVLSRRFPGLLESLRRRGAVEQDIGHLNCWYAYGGLKKVTTVGVNAMTMSRPLLDHVLLQELRSEPRLELLPGHRVVGHVLDEDRRAVTGVELAIEGAPVRVTRRADLVVDCTGRGSRVPAYLERWGYRAPRESTVKVGITYKSRRYRAGARPVVPRRIYIHSPEAPREKVGYMFMPIEGGQWILTLAGWHGVDPLPDDAQLSGLLASLPCSEFREVLEESEAASEVSEYKYGHSLRRHYEELSEFPHRLLVIGDAVASVNPVYGQGMSLSCLQADALDRVLSTTPLDGELARRVYARIAPVIHACWTSATIEDFRYRETVGEKPFGAALVNAYLTGVHKASQRDAVVYSEFLKVAGLLKPATALFAPGVVIRSVGDAVLRRCGVR
ncbi:MAG: FAD-dependent monooxygenase [Kofleriaceae bacterium]